MAARKKSHKRASRRPRSGLLRGHFGGRVDPALDRVNRSFEFDRRMWAEDIRASRAHVQMLAGQDILPHGAANRILSGLAQIEAEFARGAFRARAEDEDIHMAVERRLTEIIGEDGMRLHTARSRNDQVATDLLLYLDSVSARLRTRVRDVQTALLALARRDGAGVLPFYTHLQRAQPVLLGHVLLAYVEMLASDHEALEFPLQDCPLGSGAGTGTTFPIDRTASAKTLGFKRPARNSLAAVSSRQEATSFAAAMARCAITLSRLGGDIVLWTTREFGFARLADAVSTGSSIMPQKRNPDGAELLRAQALRVAGAHAALLDLPRGLPLGYFKDLQEDKVHLFAAEDTLSAMLEVAGAMLRGLTFDADRMRAAVDDPNGYLLATEVADWLTRRGTPFREAHAAVASLVRDAERKGIGLRDLPLEAYRAVHPSFSAAVYDVLSPTAAVRARSAVGGTAPANVRREIRRWERLLAPQGTP